MVKKIYKIKESDDSSEKSIKIHEDTEKLQDGSEHDNLGTERIEIFLDAFLTGYKTGEINLERMCIEFNDVLKTIPLNNETPFLWQKIYMGRLVIQALEFNPPKGKRTKGQFTEIKRICTELVRMAREKDGFIINRFPASTDISAFEMAAHVMNGYGFKTVTPTKVQRWCTEVKDHST